MRHAAFLFRPKEDDGPDGEDDDKRDGDQADNDADRTKDGTDGTIKGGIPSVFYGIVCRSEEEIIDGEAFVGSLKPRNPWRDADQRETRRVRQLETKEAMPRRGSAF